MKILLVNVDCKRFNLAIRRIYNYYLQNGDDVTMTNLGLNGYPSKKVKVIDATEYDRVYVSSIFEINRDKYKIINCDNNIIGGVGSVNSDLKLPKEIEQTEPYYFDYEDTSYGFITRGCIRNCWFCKVPEHEGKLSFYNHVDSIVKHKKVIFYDNNILAYSEHKEIFKYLISLNIRCDFNQGLDFRLIDDENAELLSKIKWLGEYKFAFDDIKYKELLEEKLKIIKKYITKDWKLKFYVYHNANMDIRDLIARIEWCRENKCLPYFMRDKNCWESPYRNFYIDYATYCNYPSIYKKVSFEEFILKRHKNKQRIYDSLNIMKRYS